MIAVLYGRDDFSAHEALAALMHELDSDPSMEGLAENTARVEGAAARPDELLALCQTVPFLASHRLVIVEGLLSRFESAGARRGRSRRKQASQESALAEWERFIEALPSLPESTALVFLDGELDASRNAFLQALRPLARIEEFRPLAQGDVAGWITRRAQQYGVSLQARAVAALAGLVGNHLWTLDSELRKLAVYAGDSQVSEDDVRSLVSLAREPNVFAMADAVIEGRARDAVDLFQRLLAEGEPPQRLLTMIARQYRLLLLAKEMLDQGTRPPEISARLRVQGFVIQRLLQQAPLYNIETLRAAYRRLLDADLSVKRGIQDEETALELLIFELAALAGSRRATPPAGRRGYSRPRGGPGRAPSGAGTAPSGSG